MAGVRVIVSKIAGVAVDPIVTTNLGRKRWLCVSRVPPTVPIPTTGAVVASELRGVNRLIREIEAARIMSIFAEIAAEEVTVVIRGHVDGVLVFDYCRVRKLSTSLLRFCEDLKIRISFRAEKRR
jgi:hypothetical protein